jgi:cellulose synthase/poly-beta-1,6-N-acetylglucosamine synthase-like glycosyltransferase
MFWVCAALVVYAYSIYPALVWCLSRVLGRREKTAPAIHDGELPAVTLLIAAYNEEAVIAERLENALRADYPATRLRIVVASDGSADRTAEIVRGFADCGVALLDYKARRGKSSVLNSAMAEIDSDVVLLSDANTHIHPTAARKLARWFADPEVGAVCGRLVLTDPQTGANVDSVYWKYETFLKKCDARLGGLLGSNGAIYAIRRSLYVPIPDSTIVDDFVIPLLMKQAHGCHILYDSTAVATEEAASDVRAEFRRRTRIGAGGFQAIALMWRLLDPRRGWVAFTFLSHKILRWLCPFFLLAMLATSLALALVGHSTYRYALALQLAFYTVSLVASRVPGRAAILKPLRLATMFTSMNAALLIGFCRWLRGSQKSAWERTIRLAEAARSQV